MTHTVDNRMQLVSAGAVPILVRLLNSPDYDIQYYCTTSLSNIAVDYTHRKLLSSTEPNVVVFLIRLTDSPALKVQCQATLALRNLASDDFFQVEIVKQHGLSPLHQLLQSQIPQIILASVACIRNISIHPSNESPIVEAGFLPLLLELLVVDNPEIQCHSMSTIRNLASSDENKAKIIESGAIQRIGELLRLQEGVVSDNVKSEMTACLAVLALM
ncbi:Vacuolar protein 8, partial [Rhizoclosmatium hyalinum]